MCGEQREGVGLSGGRWKVGGGAILVGKMIWIYFRGVKVLDYGGKACI
jgi:hypothetical protein